MKNQNAPLYAVAAAILVVGLAFVGVPMTTLLIGLVVLACPLSMLFMMSGMRGKHDESDHQSGTPEDKKDQPSKSARRS
jgi:hypothetical protein